jgi:Calx-beta domain-containing protein/pre-peptidase
MEHVSLRLRAVACAAFAALGVLCFAAGGEAAIPPGGTIGTATSSVSWQGQYYAVAAVDDPNLCPPGALDPGDTICDHFALTVQNPGTVTVTITWPSANCANNPTNPTPGVPCDTDGNDWDLYVYDSAGMLVAASANPNPPGNSESTSFTATAQTYEVRVVPFFVVNSDYSGTATFAGGGGGGGGGGGLDPPISVGNATVWEGDSGTTSATFAVWMDWASIAPVTVNYATLNDTAGVGDYVSSAGVVVFQPGQTFKTVTVPVIGDTTPENTERFEVRLTLPDPPLAVARLEDYQGFGTIRDSDWYHRVIGSGSVGGGSFSLSVDNYRRGKLTYRASTWKFYYRSFSVATFNDATKGAHVEGTGWKNGALMSFVLDVRDAAPGGLLDTFVFKLSDGTTVSGTLSSGDLSFQA